MEALLNSDGGGLSSEFIEKERVHTRCLQQRLEQLVTVHRQLLRKFTSLELENGELKKKISLRNERIKQLEVNARKMTSKLRIQIERHVSELTNLQESVAVRLNNDYYSKMLMFSSSIVADDEGGAPAEVGVPAAAAE